MLLKQNVPKEKIKDYWETRAPQLWYSNKIKGTLEWFNELEYKRYNVFYNYIPTIAEFKYHNGEKVLEIGVGVGTDLVQFAKGGALVSGIDLTSNAIEVTKQNFKLNNLTYEYLNSEDAENLPFIDQTFDYIYSFGVLHHTPNIDKAIKEIHRVLKNEGKVTIMLYARGWKHYFKRIFIHGILGGKLFKYGYKKLINKQTEVHGNSPLTYILTKKEIKKIFRMFGDIEIIRYKMGEYIDYAPYKTKKIPLWLENIFYLFAFQRIFGENYIIKAVKTSNRKKYSFFKTLLKP